jgi:hypothetical protein
MKFLETFKTILIVVLLLIIFSMRSCGENNIKLEPTTQPETISDYKNQIPIETVVVDTIHDTIKVPGRKVIIENKVNKELAKKYLIAEQKNDSLTQRNMYLSQITLREYTDTFEDKYTKTVITTGVEGNLKYIKPIVTIKERTLEQPTKILKTTFAIYTGVGIYNNINFQTGGLNLNLGVQNKKGDLFIIQYDPINKAGFVNYNKRLINITK